MSGSKGEIHSYETFAAADGPGVRFLVFLSGCPFRCAYCHNPDTWAKPAAEKATADEVLRRALRYRAYWGRDGGLTVSGGEPMLQAGFVTKLFEKARREKVTTCLDTAAGPFVDDGRFDALFAATDTVLLDIKEIDDARHRALTGASNAPVLACARRLSAIGKPVWIRYVLVPGLTDGADDLRRLGDFLRTLRNIARFDILPYHTFGVEKWRKLGLPYALAEVTPPTAEALARARNLIGPWTDAPKP
ncbi:MAG: pyruvate formate-lyase-activating protein [Kiritimatiellia bacterium]